MDSLINKISPLPGKVHTTLMAAAVPPKMHYKKRERVTICESKSCHNIAISGTFRNSKGFQLISTGLPLLHSI